MTLRICLDLNVLVADRLARDRGRGGAAASTLVEAVAAGTCPAGPVQLVTSVPIIENWADVLRRFFGYDRLAAGELAWILQAYAIDGPLGFAPQVVLGSGHVPFETDEQMRASVLVHERRENVDKLFDEVTDDRHVLVAALAGRADILATANMQDFVRGPAVALERDDVALFPWGGRTLVIARPAFVAHWLRQGVVPDHAFVAANPDEFRPRDMGAAFVK